MTNPTRKTLVRGSTLGAGVLLALALLVIVNYFGWKYHERFDWTRSEIHSLSEKTENVLASLDQPVEIIVFLTPMQGNPEIYQQVRNLVQLYEAASQQVSVRFMDPARNLAEAQQLAERFELANPNVVVVASGDDKRILLESELGQMDFSGGMGAAPTLANFRGEQAITGAILELAEQRKPKILFTTGHGERSLDEFGPDGFSTLRDLLNLENLEAEEWASLNQPRVPEDADLVVIAAPSATFLEPELEVLGTWAATGGRLLVLLDPELTVAGGLGGTGLSEWLAGYGVEVGADVVVDPSRRIPFFGDEIFYVESYGNHPVTETLRDEGLPVLVSLARSVRQAETDDDTAGEEPEITELLFTTPNGWGETDLSNLRAVEQNDDDLAGPVALGVVVEEELESAADEAAGEAEPEGSEDTEDSESAEDETENGGSENGASENDGAEHDRGRSMRLVVLGDSDFAANRLLQTNAANQVLVSDILNWMVEREELTGIPPKEPEQVRLNLSRPEVNWIRTFSLAVLPVASILLGLWIWYQRRR